MKLYKGVIEQATYEDLLANLKRGIIPKKIWFTDDRIEAIRYAEDRKLGYEEAFESKATPLLITVMTTPETEDSFGAQPSGGVGGTEWSTHWVTRRQVAGAKISISKIR